MQCPYQLNVDEGQVLAQAMRYEQDLTPWRAVDGETGGPILSWLPLLAHKIGLPFDFRMVHILAVLCLVGTLLATYTVASQLLGEAAAVIGLAAGSWWLAATPDADFIHYSSELVPSLLLSVALVALVTADRGRAGGGRIFFGGLLLGLIPWAKLQAVPIGVVLGLWALVDISRAQGVRPARRCLRVVLLVVGSVAPTALILRWVASAGAWDQFWHSYILANLSRAAGEPWPTQGAKLVHLLFAQEGSSWFLDAFVLVAGAFWLRAQDGARALPGRPMGLAVLLLAAALFAVLRPITQYSHYEQLCLVPLMLVAGCCARVILADGTPAPGQRKRTGWIVLAVGLLPLSLAYFWRFDEIRALRQAMLYENSAAFQIETFVDSAVRQFAPHPESLAVWGWAPYLYVDLGIPPGTRDAGYTSLHDGNPSQDFMRASFFRDLVASAPQVIVDTEDYIAGGVRQTAPAIFPAFADFLKKNYGLVGRGTATRGRDYSVLVDVYVRRPSAVTP